jgi:hypothetical protein
LKPRIALPIAAPVSGSLPGPTTISTITITMMRWAGVRPQGIAVRLSVASTSRAAVGSTPTGASVPGTGGVGFDQLVGWVPFGPEVCLPPRVTRGLPDRESQRWPS